ncbi:hypothetical protein BDN71DRAFT_1446362 [Pleurotus eryngii]|uniref:Uncharacterized protein n=1 Tax=Pleurotus eryngii TaxID=5323 RepID=A0A9P5ZZL3_PLEER|nr:hypothetical protein BDN71DRAFT_1446362 [Pleurotus eryngii]
MWRSGEASFAIDFGYTTQTTNHLLPTASVRPPRGGSGASLTAGGVLASVALLAVGGIDTTFDAFGYRLLRIRVDSPRSGRCAPVWAQTPGFILAYVCSRFDLALLGRFHSACL